MQLTFLGQAGWLLRSGSHTVIIDPYLSDSVVKVNPRNFRRQPIREEFLKVIPDYLLCTHNHLDHYDPETMPHYLDAGAPITVLAPQSVFAVINRHDTNNYVQFDRHSRWSGDGITFTAVKAVHSDPAAIGFLIECEGKTLYFTGDTLYNTEIFGDIRQKVDVLFLPINGVGNNMNLTDARAFAAQIGAQTVVPMHFGMFDETTPEAVEAAAPGFMVPRIYETYTF